MSVERGSGLIEEQDTGVLQDSSRDSNLEKMACQPTWLTKYNLREMRGVD